jgi:hypothetical protein
VALHQQQYTALNLLLLLLLQVTTPVAIMTSDAKGNHDRISGLMDSHNWFGRSPDSFRLFRYMLCYSRGSSMCCVILIVVHVLYLCC